MSDRAGAWAVFDPDAYDRHREEALAAADRAIRERFGSLWARKTTGSTADPLINAHVVTCAVDAAASRLRELAAEQAKPPGGR